LAAERPRAIAAVALVAGLLLLGMAGSWRAPAISTDEGLVLEYPQLIMHGEAPFRDFQSSYGIGTYLPLAAAYDALGPSVSVERTVGVTYRLAIVLGVLALLWPLGLGLATLGGAAATLAIVPLGSGSPPVAYGWEFALACVLWALWSERAALFRSEVTPGLARGLWAVSGVLVGAAVSARPDLGAAALVSSAVLLRRTPGGSRIAFGAGVLFGAAPLIWNLAVAGWSAFWIYGVQAREHQLPVSGYRFPSGIGVMLAGTASVLLLILRAARERHRHGPSPLAAGWIAIALLSALILPQLFQRADAGHFAFVATLSFGCLPWTGWRRRLPRPVTVFVLVLCALALAITALAAAKQSVFSVRNAGRSFPVASPERAADLHRTLRWLDVNEAPGRRLFVGPADMRWAFYTPTEIYYLAPALRPAGFYLELGPGDDTASFTRRIVADLRRADVLVLDHLYVPGWRSDVWPEARIGSPAPNAFITHRFRVVFRAGEFEVLVRRLPPHSRPGSSHVPT
jgi:hypothetical protein